MSFGQRPPSPLPKKFHQIENNGEGWGRLTRFLLIIFTVPVPVQQSGQNNVGLYCLRWHFLTISFRCGITLWRKSWAASGYNSWIRCTKGVDIRLISLISGCWIRSEHDCFQQFFKSLLSDHCPRPLVSDWYLDIFSWYFKYSVEICYRCFIESC